MRILLLLPMLCISSCAIHRGEPNLASIVLMAPVVLPIAGIHAINEAERRADERRYNRERERREREIKANRKDGPFTEYWDNGKKRSEGTYKNKELNGFYTTWHENGQKDSEGNWKDGKRDSVWTEYSLSGGKDAEGTYKDDKREGVWTDYWQEDLDGKKYKGREQTCKNGLKNGLTTTWHENGQRSSEKTYKGGKSNGPSREWYKTGENYSEAMYKNHSMVSYISYYKDGKKITEVTSRGKYKYFSRDGKEISWSEHLDLNRAKFRKK
ncbi:MAG: toxin-antitoxin system YwqK family antitoxin [Verrucomicrobiaceae bacterium]|nr:toxin-antitoxin system YwqK family antitoxin [Verrucomicrobiaceae bacterium]